MSRIPLPGTERQPDAIRRFMTRRGELNVFRLLANAPQVFTGWTRMVDEMLDSPTFSVRMLELIILRVAHLQGSSYEFHQHERLARSGGLTEQQIDAITNAGDLDAAGFSHRERAVLDLVTELCTTRRLRAGTFAAARAALGDAAVTELLIIISCYYGLALVVNAVELEVDVEARLRA
jgi:4-carboxymuconolactone decarboxylase